MVVRPTSGIPIIRMSTTAVHMYHMLRSNFTSFGNESIQCFKITQIKPASSVNIYFPNLSPLTPHRLLLSMKTTEQIHWFVDLNSRMMKLMIISIDFTQLFASHNQLTNHSPTLYLCKLNCARTVQLSSVLMAQKPKLKIIETSAGPHSLYA
jgi:hypothetical protein